MKRAPGALDLSRFIPRSAVVGLSLVLLATACAPQATSPSASSPGATAPAQVADPRAQLIIDFIADRDSSHEEAAAALFADDGFAALNNPVGNCNYRTPCFGRAAILKGIQTIDDRQPNRCSKVISTEVTGDIVTGRIDVRHDGLRQRGIERIYLAFLAQVQDGKILSFYVRPDLADPQTALNEATPLGQTAAPPIPGHCSG